MKCSLVHAWCGLVIIHQILKFEYLFYVEERFDDAKKFKHIMTDLYKVKHANQINYDSVV